MLALRVPGRIRRLLERQGLVRPASSRISYAQCGEDLIMDLIFTGLRLPQPTYLDIGANDPVNFSNTYYFYQKGCRGVCVEPDPNLAEAFRRRRPKDTCLNAGVGVGRQ